MTKRAKVLSFVERGDSEGKLIAIEEFKDIGFQISRIFYIYNTLENVTRGKHANRNSDFIIINVHGSSKIRVDYGNEIEEFLLDSPAKGLYIPKMLWKEMYDFSPGSVMLVLSNHRYDPTEYINDYSEYISIINN